MEDHKRGRIKLVKKFDSEFPERYFQEFIDYLNIDKQTFLKL